MGMNVWVSKKKEGSDAYCKNSRLRLLSRKPLTRLTYYYYYYC